MAEINKIQIPLSNLDALYRKLKTVDEYARDLQRYTDEIEIKKAMRGYLSSFGLSMIKDMYFENTNSAGFILSIRCILEGLAVYFYTETTTISQEHQDMFKLQALFIEKDIYERYKNFDQQLFYLEEITNNYKDYFETLSNKYELTPKVLKGVLQSSIPFLGDVKSFESLIRDTMPSDLLVFYKIVSYFVHPYDYRINTEDLFLDSAHTTFKILEELFTDVKPSKFGLVYEFERLIKYNDYATRVEEVTHIQTDKLLILCDMLGQNRLNYLAFSLNECIKVMGDYFLDVSMGYIEQTTTKWKTVIENLWMFNLAITNEEFGRDNILLDSHGKIKTDLNFNDKLDESLLKLAYENYKQKHPNGCEFDIFTKSFTTVTGYTINEQGETISLRKAAYSLINELGPKINEGKFSARIKNNEGLPSTKDNEQHVELDLTSFMKMKYDESQVMSHATGYLYYSLTGAWSDGNVIAYLYDELVQLLLKKLLCNLKELHKNKKIDKSILNWLRNFIKDNEKYVLEKRELYLMPKVQKTF